MSVYRRVGSCVWHPNRAGVDVALFDTGDAAGVYWVDVCGECLRGQPEPIEMATAIARLEVDHAAAEVAGATDSLIAGGLNLPQPDDGHIVSPVEFDMLKQMLAERYRVSLDVRYVANHHLLDVLRQEFLSIGDDRAALACAHELRSRGYPGRDDYGRATVREDNYADDTLVIEVVSEQGWRNLEEVHLLQPVSLLRGAPVADLDLSRAIAAGLERIGWQPLRAIPATVPQSFGVVRLRG